jgi:hypothetical protein
LFKSSISFLVSRKNKFTPLKGLFRWSRWLCLLKRWHVIWSILLDLSQVGLAYAGLLSSSRKSPAAQAIPYSGRFGAKVARTVRKNPANEPNVSSTAVAS